MSKIIKSPTSPGPGAVRLSPGIYQLPDNFQGGGGAAKPGAPGGIVNGQGTVIPTNVTPGQFQGALTDLSGGNKTIGQALNAGQTLAGSFYPQGSLGRIDPTLASQPLSPEQQNLQDRYRAESFIGGYNNSQVQGALDNLGTQAQNAGQNSALDNDLLARRQAGLGGLTAPENTALLEQGQVGLNRGLQTTLGQLRSAFPGAHGAAAAGAATPAINAFANSNQDLQRNIMLSNYGAKQQALKDYQGLGTDLEARNFSQAQTAGTNFNNAVTANNAFNVQDRTNRLNNYSNFLNGQLGQQNAINQYNNTQGAAERTGQIGLLFGSGSFGAAQDQAAKAQDIALKGVQAAGGKA